MALNSLLKQLEQAAEAAHPGWKGALKPGLTDEQIEAALAPLDGWHVPDQIVELYRWANGQEEEHCLWVPCQLLPLEQAVAILLQLRESMPLAPPLLPFAAGLGTLEVPLSREKLRSQTIYYRTGYPFRAFRDVAGLLRAATECYRQGVFTHDPEQGWSDPSSDDSSSPSQRRAHHEIRLRLNPATSPTLEDEGEARGEMWIDPHDATTWPGSWHAWIGFDPEGYSPRGATAKVTDVVIGRVKWKKPVVVQGVVEVVSGAFSHGASMRATISDGVQRLQVLCPGVLATGLAVGSVFEFELERPLDDAEAAQLEKGDEAIDRQVRESMRKLATMLLERPDGREIGEDDLSIADFVDMGLGQRGVPAYLARRVALVERREPPAEDAAGDPDPEEMWNRNYWRGPEAFTPAEDIETLARTLLASYRNGYRLVHDMQPVDVAGIDGHDDKTYDRVARTLEDEGFRQLGDWEIANLHDIWPNHPRVAMRGFAHPDGTVAAAWTLPKPVWAALTPPRKPPRDGIVDLVTEYKDGRVYLTTTAGDLLKLQTPHRREKVPLGARVREVVARHRERLAAEPPGKPLPARTFKDYLKQVRARHLAERDFHNGRIPTPEELVLMGCNPDLADRVHAAMKALA
jgi:hypothetical protein